MRIVGTLCVFLGLVTAGVWAQEPGAPGLPGQSVSAYSSPFSGFAIGVKAGTLGPGLEVATPLAHTLNLRAGGNYFTYGDSFTSSGVTYNATLRFLSGEVSLDWFPWAGGFHISGGAVVYNGNQITGTSDVPGGQTFTLNHVTYVSSASDPVHGTGSLRFNKAAPKVTIGWGNLLPRGDRHWSVPFELGMAYVGDPKVALNLTGTVCDTTGANCRTIASDPSVQANVTAQQQKLASDAQPARFYPILTVGVGYAF